MFKSVKVDIKSAQELATMRKAAQVVAETLKILMAAVEPGITTQDLDALAEKSILKMGARLAFKGYRGFSATLCASINDEVVHGIPDPKRRLNEGDIIGLDLGAIVDGYYGDSAATVGVGKISDEAARLIRVTQEALHKGIEAMRNGNRLHDIGFAVQTHAEAAGYTVVREFVGHGIGRQLHEDPAVPNYGQKGTGLRLRPGMVLAVEPMVNAGAAEVRTLDDGWTAVTADGKLSAHFEHTIAVTEDGPEILTERR